MTAVNLDQLAEFLTNVGHFRRLPLGDRRAIVAAGHVRRHPRGSIIFMEDEPCAGMHVLLSGKVHLVKVDPRGHEQIVAVMEPVIMFNEVAALDGGPNPVTAIAAQESQTWSIPHEALYGLLKQYPDLSLGLLQVLARRNRMLIELYQNLATRPVVGRLAKLLLDLSDGGRHPIQRRQHSIREMAGRISTVPEAISRSLKVLKERGAIDYTRGQIQILKPSDLADLAQINPFNNRP
jgi:CRP/FNR family transcriptional regulator